MMKEIEKKAMRAAYLGFESIRLKLIVEVET